MPQGSRASRNLIYSRLNGASNAGGKKTLKQEYDKQIIDTEKEDLKKVGRGIMKGLDTVGRAAAAMAGVNTFEPSEKAKARGKKFDAKLKKIKEEMNKKRPSIAERISRKFKKR